MANPSARIWLRTRRAERDQLQAEAALEVGVSRATWSRWTSGEAIPTLEQAVALSRWSGCALDEVAEAFGLEVEVPEVEPLVPPGALDHRGAP
jgi:transcriptional regulator with XRE-family HTH domain